ncbi:probable glucuronokinase 2 [Actinia tenebrosa]|uniref:Probable glucuronokinase 2 n=1 Tax=Actinia tenebrosa TaxID=6105 RepID=A0A6P8HEA6_ACTTE|nr:probable glucuronokinase 2 [Actinia tenebrosa]
MDFSKSLMDGQGHGDYIQLDSSCAPFLWLAYHTDPSDSGKIHSNVRMRWNQGDTVIVEAMQKFADLTDLAKNALLERDYERFSDLMNQNFDLRRSIYGDEALGQTNLRMIELARQFGSSAKFPGSGGAIIGYCHDQSHLEDLKRAFQAEGFVVLEVVPFIPSS